MHRGGGNSLKLSHNQDFSLIEAFNNLALWGEKKFVSKLKRAYKFKRGVYCHTEDNSPKYRMVGEILSILRSFAVQTRIFAKECNIMAGGYVRSTNRIIFILNEITTSLFAPRNDSFAIFTAVVSVGWAF